MEKRGGSGILRLMMILWDTQGDGVELPLILRIERLKALVFIHRQQREIESKHGGHSSSSFLFNHYSINIRCMERDAWSAAAAALQASVHQGNSDCPPSVIRVPVFPAIPSAAFSKRVMRAVRPGADSANAAAASTLGSMDPGAKCPCAI